VIERNVMEGEWRIAMRVWSQSSGLRIPDKEDTWLHNPHSVTRKAMMTINTSVIEYAV